MIIRKLHIRNFKKLKNKSLDFKKGVNVICGANEMGKSTVADAVLTVLFMDPLTKSKGFFKDKIGWSNDGMKYKPVLELEFEDSGDKYILKKDFAKREAFIHNKTKDIKDENVRNVSKKIAELFGIKRKDVYESTGFIKGEDILDINKSKGLISATHKAVSRWEKEEVGDVSTILSKIDKKIGDIKRGVESVSKNPGPLKVLSKEREEMERVFDEEREKFRQKSKNLNKLDKSLKELEVVKSEYSELRMLVDAQHKYKDLVEKEVRISEELSTVEKDMDSVSKYKRQIQEIDLKRSKYKDFSKENLEEILAKSGLLADDIEFNTKRLREIGEDIVKNSPKSNRIFIWCFSGGAVIGILFGMLGYILELYYIFGILSGISLITAMYFLYMFLNDHGRQKIYMLQSEYQSRSGLLKSGERKLEKLLNESGVGTLENLLKVKRIVVEDMELKEKLNFAVSEILRGRSFDDLKKLHGELLVKSKEVKLAKEALYKKCAGVNADNHKSNIGKLDKLEKQLITLERTKAVLESTQAELNTSLEEIKILENEILELDVQIEAYEKKVKVLKSVRDYIERAMSDVAASVNVILSKEVNHYLDYVTDSEYGKIKIDKNLDLEVYVNQLKKWIDPVEKLSTGTVGQIYFLYRLALFKVLAKDKSPFLLLDDPFLTFDKNRLGKVKEILQQESEKYQIILFSHDLSYKKWGYKVSFSD